MVTLEEVLRWRPDSLTEIADALNNRRKRLNDVHDELPRHMPESWLGLSADAGAESYANVPHSLDRAVSAQKPLVTALDTAAEAIRKVQRSIDGALAQAQSHGFDVDTTSGVISDSQTYSDPGAAQHAQRAMDEVSHQLTSALHDATAADHELAAAARHAQSALSKVGGPLTPSQKALIAEVNQGIISDPKAAFALPTKDFNAAGQKALADWANAHTTSVAGLIAHGHTVNLPPSPNGYDFQIHAVETSNMKLEYELLIPPATGAAGLVVGLTGGKPSLSGTLSGGNEAGSQATSVDGDGWTAKALANIGGDNKAGITWGKEGPWIEAEHEHETEVSEGREATLRTVISVRPDPPDPHNSDPWPARALHSVEHGVEHAASATGHEVGHLAGQGWGWFNEQPVGTKMAIGSGLALLVVTPGVCAVVAAPVGA